MDRAPNRAPRRKCRVSLIGKVIRARLKAMARCGHPARSPRRAASTPRAAPLRSIQQRRHVRLARQTHSLHEGIPAQQLNGEHRLKQSRWRHLPPGPSQQLSGAVPSRIDAAAPATIRTHRYAAALRSDTSRISAPASRARLFAPRGSPSRASGQAALTSRSLAPEGHVHFIPGCARTACLDGREANPAGHPTGHPTGLAGVHLQQLFRVALNC